MAKLIIGPMFAGKTTELIRLADRESLAGKKVLYVTYSGDNRYVGTDSKVNVASHTGSKREAILCTSLKDIMSIAKDYDVIAIDEMQFISDGVTVIKELLASGKRLYIAGLSTKWNLELWPNIVSILHLAEIKFLTAVCKDCGNDATHTALPGGTNDTIKIGIDYKAVCLKCHAKYFPLK